MSEGYCDVDLSVYGEDSDPVQFYASMMVRARKLHVCTECRGPIAIGEQHRRISYRFEGKFHVDRMCALCSEIAGEFEHNTLGGFLWEWFAEEWDNGANLQGCMNRLDTAAAKEHMRQQWLKRNGLNAEGT